MRPCNHHWSDYCEECAKGKPTEPAAAHIVDARIVDETNAWQCANCGRKPATKKEFEAALGEVCKMRGHGWFDTTKPAAPTDLVASLKLEVARLGNQIKQMNQKQRMHLATEVMKVVIPQLGTLDTPDDVTDYAFRVADAMLERAKK